MTAVTEVTAFLDELLDVAVFREHEAENGLLFDSGRPVRRLGAAVNTSLRAIERAAELRVDLLLVHHPSWPYIDLRTHEPKMSRLRAAGISLYGAHASLDGAPALGTGTALAWLLGLQVEGRFAEYEGATAGVHGSWSGTFDDLVAARFLGYRRRSGGPPKRGRVHAGRDRDRRGWPHELA